jgi:D-3-phosphoglycerate dehydrogenase
MKKNFSFPPEKMNVLFLEGIHPAAAERMQLSGYRAKMLKQAYSEEELCREISSVHVLGIRSKTEVTKRALDCAKNLLAIGCFCIGTDQVDLDEARRRGIPVFNAPFSNTRSVAELAIAEMVMLARHAAHKSQLLHSGV